MKFKMAPNSLFAVLLRSPWWVSMGLAFAFAAGSRALLPDAYWVFGALGALPLLVVGVVVLVRQWRAPSDAQMESVLVALRAMGWREFSAHMEAALARDGFAVTRLNNKSADFEAVKSGRTTLVAARRWKAATQGMDALQALRAMQRAQDAGATMVVTLGDFSEQARNYAQAQGMLLVQGAQLAHLLRGLVPGAGTTAVKAG